MGTLAMWAVVKIIVPFWVLSIIRHLVFRGPKRGLDLEIFVEADLPVVLRPAVPDFGTRIATVHWPFGCQRALQNQLSNGLLLRNLS